jgi:hypothetical protein
VGGAARRDYLIQRHSTTLLDDVLYDWSEPRHGVHGRTVACKRPPLPRDRCVGDQQFAASAATCFTLLPRQRRAGWWAHSVRVARVLCLRAFPRLLFRFCAFCFFPAAFCLRSGFLAFAGSHYRA